ncbi:UvrD-helicase domain-containing protein [Hydromonas duriensis]|uniref:DNA 3'-5' helicase n=1 Tax=Hydromonas duriensis TaxID=1527608 RepID=A0A4R6Y172_9BURK|nr:UvrD-helicase domain-containing protein [Hydromonas duriensis]TDR29092.1 DNA helicase/exodeoxyribonuclease V subunit A [Hydromonas duriensis]
MNNSIQAYEINHEPCAAGVFNYAALDPSRSIVVRASAGSGKTWLLTSRIIRLLLEGVLPHHMLAITFTKKAAQEMRDRVASILQALADEPEAVVLKQLIERGLTEPEALAALPKARTLYNDVLGSGQDIPIFTFHAWFYRLLQAAPMGSGVMRDATLLEDASELRMQAWDDFYKQFNTVDGEILRAHYLNLVRELGEEPTKKLLNEGLAQSTELLLFRHVCAREDRTVLEYLAQDILLQTGLDVSLGEAGVYQRWSDELANNPAFAVWLNVLAHGDEKKQIRSQTLLNISKLADATQKYARMREFLVKGGDRIDAQQNKITKAQVNSLMGVVSEDEYAAALASLNDGFKKVQHDLADLRAYQLHIDALPCVEALIERYQTIKRRTRQLDFSDIEYQCFELLSHPDTAAYVQVQLDARYKHLLFDEFQDTNPLQWQIIKSWLDAYEHDAVKPRVFIVGDVKQSIYRFRKADARLFDAAQQLLIEKYQADVLKTHATRRNSHAVVNWVNGLFRMDESELAESFSAHSTFNEDIGHVACLGLSAVEQAEESEEASEPSDDSATNTNTPAPRHWLTQPKHVIAANVRDEESVQLIQAIQQLVGHYPVKDEHTGEYRPARYSDMMLLVYTRTHLTGYERLLREAHIPFISSRRGGLLDTLEALDLMALVQWLMDASDDLALLHVLRTPIFDVSHEDLAILLDARTSFTENDIVPSYWQVMLQANDLIPNLQKAKDLLLNWLAYAQYLPPHDVLDRIYAQSELLKRYAERVPQWLNAQVQANLRAFLQLALTVNAGRYPSLSSYLQALKRWQALDKEGLSEAEPLGMNNAVRILTVHASKGLEAPIVMLIDMKTKTAKSENNLWFVDWPVLASAPTHVSWLGTKERTGAWRASQLADSAQRGRVEKWNQCYVAMTRARQLLVVSAAQLKTDDAEEKSSNTKQGLFDYLQQAMNDVPESQRLSAQPIEWGAQLKKWSTNDGTYIEPSDSLSGDKTALTNKYIDIALTEEVRHMWHEVSIAAEYNADEARKNHAAALGTAWHGALQFATDNWGERLNDAELVQRFGITLDDAKIVQTWLTQTLQRDEWQAWFDPQLYDEAVNEMSIITAKGMLKRIDRWVRKADKLTVMDFKSDWTEANLPEYEAQLREYMSLMAQLYPTHKIEGVLLAPTGKQHELIL